MTDKQQVNISEMNAVIGLFHNRTLEKGENGQPDRYVLMGACYTTDPLTLGYHSSWSELMRVVEKIEAFHLTFQIEGKIAYIQSKGVIDDRYPWLDQFDSIYVEDEKTKIYSVYKACYQFIQWYNTTSNNQIK